MVQLGHEINPEQTTVDLVLDDAVPDTCWEEVFRGQDETGRIVSLIHQDTPVLRSGTIRLTTSG
ncbi:hypothetical protein [Arthrobacter zhaoxinii]|uniref:hypothetical protein n=1 Tax=Arthrobacter zhaoxinii TaxID=2964616 RepID=UPI002103E3BA|nr:hypothetical protein [Arthrobacter zhaoxinii]MCQ2002218.1 hypothetical protein [Arthrobacter zhaoxinii]